MFMKTSTEGLNFNKNVSYTKFADGAKVKDRISVIGYPKGAQTKYKMFLLIQRLTISVERLWNLMRMHNQVIRISCIQLKHELIGILYAGSGKR